MTIENASPEPVPEKFGGWLYLLALGVVVSPVMLIIRTGGIFPIFFSDSWTFLTNPASEKYVHGFAMVVCWEVTMNVLNTLVALLAVWAFFMKSRHFPRIYQICMMYSILVLATDIFLAGFIMGPVGQIDASEAREVARGVISSMIWIPYLSRSHRVEKTFVARVALVELLWKPRVVYPVLGVLYAAGFLCLL